MVKNAYVAQDIEICFTPYDSVMSVVSWCQIFINVSLGVHPKECIKERHLFKKRLFDQ